VVNTRLDESQEADRDGVFYGVNIRICSASGLSFDVIDPRA
jgi:hypothetical protein